MHSLPPRLLGLLGLTLSVACTQRDGPDLVTIERTRYDEGFAAALAAVHDLGLTTSIRDREQGVIEAEPSVASTVLEPWRSDNSTFGQAIDHTLALRRRRVRLEFVSTDFVPTPSSEQELVGPNLLDPGDPRSSRLSSPSGDSTGGTGAPIELRVVVAVEQAHTPGLRRSTWTRLLTTRTGSPAEPIDPQDGVVSTSVWTPIGRDELFERRVLGAVAERLTRIVSQPRG